MYCFYSPLSLGEIEFHDKNHDDFTMITTTIYYHPYKREDSLPTANMLIGLYLTERAVA